MKDSIFFINSNSDIPKFRQLVNNINYAIANDQLVQGDLLPSVNQLCSEAKLSRDTVFKSYQILKKQGVIDSVPNKGYFVAKEVRRIFLLLDTFKAYKEVLFHAFEKYATEKYIVDVHFHNYSPEIFDKLIQDSLNQYTYYVIMPFDNEDVRKTISKVKKSNMLIIDWNTFNEKDENVICQDFGVEFENSMIEALPHLKKYKALKLVYPNYTNHPKNIKAHFSSFSEEHKFEYSILEGKNDFNIEKNTVYVTVSERSLGYILKKSKGQGLEMGVDFGLISYNENPMKEFIGKGISVISTDFVKMGKQAAQFIIDNNNDKINKIIPTKFIKRDSL